MLKNIVRPVALGLVLVLLAANTAAQTPPYPNKPVRLIVPTSASGGADALARALGPRLAQGLGQSVVIENKAGEAGNIAADQVAKSLPDGYTLLVGAIAPLAINPSLFHLPYDTLRDFAPITGGVVFANVLVAHLSVPANNVRELVALARAHPGAINYGSSGPGTAGHLAGELLADMAHVSFVHVPYKGGGPAMLDLLGGRIQLIFASPPSAIPYIKSGRLKALGVTGEQRILSLPDVPTISESGMAGYHATNWYCFVAPAKTPREIVMKLNHEIRKAMDSPDIRELLIGQGMEPAPSTPEELGAFMKSEIAKWKRVIQERKIAAD
jgi:tripartite-type tricarboxylate transporter receptor subunit TctC